MLTWVALGLAATTLVVVARWWLRRVDALGRTRRFPVYAAGLPALLAVVSAVPLVRHERLESRLSTVASVLAGSEVEVHCQTFGEAFVDTGAELGYVRFGVDGVPEPRTVVKMEGCQALSAYLRSSKRDPTREQVVAVHVLSHEAMHMRGETVESVTECQAMQRDARAAMLLGANEADALRLARRSWTGVYPDMPSDYRTPDCAPGRRLDEGLSGAPWLS